VAERRAGDAVVLVVGDGRAALHVPEHVVPGVTDLTGEQADRIDLALVAVADAERSKASRHQEAGVAAAQVGPVTLGFDAEHPVGSLPAIADLTTDHAAGRVMATLGDGETEEHVAKTLEVPALAGRGATAVHTDVEAAPVVDRGNDRRG